MHKYDTQTLHRLLKDLRSTLRIFETLNGLKKSPFVPAELRAPTVELFYLKMHCRLICVTIACCILCQQEMDLLQITGGPLAASLVKVFHFCTRGDRKLWRARRVAVIYKSLMNHIFQCIFMHFRKQEPSFGFTIDCCIQRNHEYY